jgi:hypothetical protein
MTNLKIPSGTKLEKGGEEQKPFLLYNITHTKPKNKKSPPIPTL